MLLNYAGVMSDMQILLFGFSHGASVFIFISKGNRVKTAIALFLVVAAVIASVFVYHGGQYSQPMVESFWLTWYHLAILISMNLALSWSFYRGAGVGPQASKVLMMILLSLGSYFVISFVQSSLTLSLGMLGALSIIRFRTPVKQPLDLVYIFSAVVLGIGLGAKQVGMTLVGFVFIWLISEVYRLIGSFSKSQAGVGGYVVLSSSGKIPRLEEYNNLLLKDFGLELLRYDESESESRISYRVQEGSSFSFINLKNAVDKLGNQAVYLSFSSSRAYEDIS